MGDFCSCEGLQEDNEAIDDLERFFLPLRTLNSFLRVFWGTFFCTFFAFRVIIIIIIITFNIYIAHFL